MTSLTAVKPLAITETEAATAVLVKKLGVSVAEACPRLSVVEEGKESMPFEDLKSTDTPEIGIPNWSRTVAVILDEEPGPSVTTEELAVISRFVTAGVEENLATIIPFPLMTGVTLGEVRSNGS